jgi:uncharacterized protein YerC
MQLSKQHINQTLERQLFKTLYQLIVDLNSVEEVEKVFSEILSKTEVTTAAKRLAIAYWLSKKRSYTNIKDNLKVSSASIAEVQQSLKKPGWKLAIAKVTADEWANVWEQRIKDVFKRK